MPIASAKNKCSRTWLSGCLARYSSPFQSLFLCLIVVFCCSAESHAAAGASGVNGAGLSLFWLIPFAGLLLSIALVPLLAGEFWHNHFGKIAAFWTLAIIAPLLVVYGGSIAAYELLHTVLLEYIPFIILIFALYTISGGVYVGGNLHGSPVTNTVLLIVGWALASFIGTTGASMVMIRPVLRANDGRIHNAHVIVFFIFIVSNVGGALTPLGDPPLFLGFLNGVDFFWPIRFMFAPTIIVTAILLCAFFLLDSYLYRKEGHSKPDPTPDSPVRLYGLVNIPLLVTVSYTHLTLPTNREV